MRRIFRKIALGVAFLIGLLIGLIGLSATGLAILLGVAIALSIIILVTISGTAAILAPISSVRKYLYLSAPQSSELLWIPSQEYLIGYVLGAALLSVYIYLLYYYLGSEEQELDQQHIYAAVLTSAVILSGYRWIIGVIPADTLATVRESLLSIFYLLPILLLILILREMTEADEDETTLVGAFKAGVHGSDEEYNRKMDQLQNSIVENNPIVRFFHAIGQNLPYVLTGLGLILFTGYVTFFFESNIQQKIDIFWVHVVTLILLLSYISAGLKGKMNN